MNHWQERLVFRLKEGELSLNRFLKLGSNNLIVTPKHPEGEYLDKAAFETDFQNHLYEPKDFDCWPRWGICGRDFLVLLDFDKKEIYDILCKPYQTDNTSHKRLPDTFEVTSPRRGLPHRYYIVCGPQVKNAKFHIPGDTSINKRGATVKNPSGEIRADNHYLVAPGTKIRYEDEHGNWITGEYTITNDIPIARMEYEDFMKAVEPFLLDKTGEQVLTHEKLANGVSAGERHDTIFRLACRLIGDNPEGRYSALIAVEMLKKWNNDFCDPPVEECFCERVVRQACEISSRSSGIPVKTIAELGFAVINERMGKGEDFKATDGILQLASQKTVDNEEVDEYIAQGYEVLKTYEKRTIMSKPAIRIESETNEVMTEEKPQESQQDRLIKYCLEETQEFFIDQHSTPFARVKMDLRYCDIYGVPLSAQPQKKFDKFEEGRGGEKDDSNPNNRETSQIPQVSQDRNIAMVDEQQSQSERKIRLVNMPINSKKFKNWLSFLFYEREYKGVGRDAVSSAIMVLMGKAQKEGKEYTLYNRVAPTDDGIWLDMCDENWRAIKITRDGWEIVENPPILFRRYSHQKPLCNPVKPSSELEAAQNAMKLLDHVNIKIAKDDDDDAIKIIEATKLAVICTSISYLIPIIAHPIMVVYGPQGAAKSYLHKIVRRVIDPSVTELLTLPHDENEIIQQLDHNWCCFYDNLTYLPGMVSDIFCRAATGSGFSKRELYSDDDDIIYSFKRCVGLNGINPAARKGDLLDRSMLVPVTKIDMKCRKTEAEVDAEFEKDKAVILGGFLSVLSLTLKKYPEVKLEGYQRLADFHKYGCAIALALGKKAEEFTKAYENKVESQTDEALNSEPVGMAILNFCETWFAIDGEHKPLHEKWEGTPASLYHEVTIKAEIMGIKTDYRSPWPKAPNAFTRKLNEIIPALLRKNFEIVIKEGTPRKVIITFGVRTLLNFPIEVPKPTIQPFITQTIPESKGEEMHFRKLNPNEVHQCDACKAVEAVFQQDQYFFCRSCFVKAERKASVDGITLVEDRNGDNVEERDYES